MDYDDWKTSSPPEEKENSCIFCENECDGEFCDSNCKKAYEND